MFIQAGIDVGFNPFFFQFLSSTFLESLRNRVPTANSFFVQEINWERALALLYLGNSVNLMNHVLGCHLYSAEMVYQGLVHCSSKNQLSKSCSVQI